jgi:hypothetical protein
MQLSQSKRTFCSANIKGLFIFGRKSRHLRPKRRRVREAEVAIENSKDEEGTTEAWRIIIGNGSRRIRG